MGGWHALGGPGVVWAGMWRRGAGSWFSTLGTSGSASWGQVGLRRLRDRWARLGLRLVGGREMVEEEVMYVGEVKGMD